MKPSKRLWIFSIGFIAFNIVVSLTRLGSEHTMLFINDLLPVICSFISAICLFMAFRKFKEFELPKVAWMLLFIGILMNFIAETTYGVLEIVLKVDVNKLFPTVADFFWCGGYIPLFAGLVTMFVGYQRSGFPMGKVKLYSILGPVVLVLFSLVIYFLLVPIIRDSETGPLAKFFYLFYPVGDLFLVIPAIILMYITSLFGRGSVTLPWRYLALGFICFTVADLLYSYLSWLDVYKSGNPIDMAWNFGYLLIGISGLYQVELIESIEGGVK